MLFARSGFALLAGALVAGIFALLGSATPWRAARDWFPVYASLIDVGCLAALWLLMRREGGRLIDLIGFDQKRIGRDVLLGLLLIAPSLALILGGISLSSLLVYGTPSAPYFFSALPVPAAVYSVVVFPLLWGFTEQMTYNGYIVPRLQIMRGGTVAAIALVAIFWSAQHAVMPVTFDGHFMLYRALAPIPFSIFEVLVYLRLRRIVPLAIAHWLMDGADAFMGSLLPLLR